MDDFYSTGSKGNDDDFFAGGPSGTGSGDFYDSSAAAPVSTAGNGLGSKF
jgi:hypothetical protein